jgi:hypothetical protein
VVVVKQMASIEAAREMERRLKAKKNPQLAIYQLNNHPEQLNQ